MSLRLILWIWILFLALIIAYFLPWYNSSLALVSILIASVFTIFQLINSSILALMQANMKIEFSLFSTVAWKLINLFWVAFIVYFLYSFVYYNWITSISIWENIPFILIFIVATIWIFINTLLNYFYARKITKFWFSFDWGYIKYIFKISLPLNRSIFICYIF